DRVHRPGGRDARERLRVDSPVDGLPDPVLLLRAFLAEQAEKLRVRVARLALEAVVDPVRLRRAVQDRRVLIRHVRTPSPGRSLTPFPVGCDPGRASLARVAQAAPCGIAVAS